MNQRGLAASFLAATLLFAAGGQAIAEAVTTWPPPGVSFNGDPGAPDVSGLWQGSQIGVPGVPPAPNRGPADGEPQVYWTPWPLPFRPAYQGIVEARAAAVQQGKALGDISARCLPFGLPKMLTSQVYPNEIVQTPGQVTFYFFGTFPLTVWTDGRGHPTDLKPSFNGHSIGHWVGDTLFVDTVGINGLTSLDHGLTPHSDKIRMSWTLRRLTPDRLHVIVTVFDEEALKEPITVVNVYRRKTDPNWQVLDDQSCFENNRTNVDEQGNTNGFVKF